MKFMKIEISTILYSNCKKESPSTKKYTEERKKMNSNPIKSDPSSDSYFKD